MGELQSMAPFAEEYASLNMPVIMVKVKDKVSAMADWPNIATTDPAVVRKWWADKNRLFNIGVVMGDRSGLVDIETDNHTTINGEDSLAVFLKENNADLPDTWTFLSGSGGIHRIYRCDHSIASRAGILPGVDVRANGGYAVFPPSVHPNGNIYKWLGGQNPSAMPDGPATLPDCLLRLLEEKSTSHKAPFELPDKIPTGERDSTLFRMAASLRAQEYTENEILSMLKAVNDDRCDPPLTARQLEKISKSVGKYERGSTRSKKVKTPELKVKSARELQEEHLPPIRWIVANMIPQGLTLLASPPKYGKSWWVLDLCLSVCAGDKFMGHYTEKSGCLYLALEDSENRLQDRINRLTYNAPAPEGFDYSITAATIDEGLIDQLEGYLDQKPETGLIVIDTLQKVKGKPVKNDSAYSDDYRQMGLIKRVADDHAIAILLVHHLKKGKGDGDAFERISGTNGIFGSADTAIVMQKVNRTDKETTLHVTGRDVIAEDSVIEFNKDSCRWENKGSVDEVEERRLTLEYENDPLVRTIKHLLKDSLIWEGTATELFNACVSLTGIPPAQSPNSLAKQIKVTAKMLWLRDQIFYFPPGKNGGAGGRKHRFRTSEK